MKYMNNYPNWTGNEDSILNVRPFRLSPKKKDEIINQEDQPIILENSDYTYQNKVYRLAHSKEDDCCSDCDFDEDALCINQDCTATDFCLNYGKGRGSLNWRLKGE